MALTGQLSDMSLAELIEFFCNQRKTGRLKIDYQRGHSVFFIKDGELVDAKVGTLSGAEAVYYSLTLPNAAFDFSPEVQPTRRTINEPWTQVVLEGLRRLDEGLSPSDADAFGNWSPSEADVAQLMDHVERLGENGQPKETGQKSSSSSNDSADVPLSFMVDSASAAGGGRKKLIALGVAASLVLVCLIAAVPLLRGSGSKPAENNAATSAPAAAQPAAPSEPAPAATADPNAAGAATTEASNADPAEAARREREERERRERERKRREEAARKEEETAAKPAATPAPQPAGPKTVRVTVNYDENGRVTQASVAGASAGAEAYGGTAVRIARGKRFPAGKAGSTVVTIPVN